MPPINFSRRALIKTTLGAATATTVLSASSTKAGNISKNPIEWKMVTSWPKNSPGLGITAQRLADRINAMSKGRLKIKLYAAGELVPALEVFDAVSGGQAEMAHTASFFWQGKTNKHSLFFTTFPFGLSPQDHMSWIYHGGGQMLWDKIYAPFSLKAFMAGNTGTQMGGWFKHEINHLDDLAGLKIRAAGLGGAIYQQLGASAIFLPPPEIYGGLQSGVVDAVEFLGPWIDKAFGFYKAAPFYYGPGFNKPNGTAECLINQQALAALPIDLQEIVENACMAENSASLAEAEFQNARMLQNLTDIHDVKIRQFPAEILKAAQEAMENITANLFKNDPLGTEILTSYNRYRQQVNSWRAVGRLSS